MLIDAGFVRAVRGQGGGIRLAQPADQIGLGDVIRATETPGEKREADEPGIESSSAAAAAIEQLVGDAFDAFIAVMNAYTLADLQRAGTRPPALDPLAQLHATHGSERSAPRSLQERFTH